MKFKSIYKIIFAAVAAIGCSSCDDFLTQENPTAELFSEYYSTVDDCETALVGVYNAITSTNNWLLYQDMLRSDMGVQGGNNTNRAEFSDECYLHSYSDAYSTNADRWAAMYIVIRRANDLLAGIEVVRTTATMTDALTTRLNQIEGQARFFRSLFYFYLSISYRHVYDDDFTKDKCVPLIKEMITDIEDLAQPCSTTQEVRDFYRADLDWVINNSELPDSWDGSDLGRVGMAAVKSVLGMTYLFEASEPNAHNGTSSGLTSDELYVKAASYFKEVIDTGAFQLATPESGSQDNNYNFTTDGEFNCESILEVSYTLTDNTEMTGYSKLYHTLGMNFTTEGGYYSCVPAMWLVDAYENEEPDVMNDNNWVDLYRDEFYGYEYDDGQFILDVVYTELGVPCVKEPYSLPSTPGYYVQEAMVHQCEGTDDNGDPIYSDTVIKRTITYKPGANGTFTLASNPTYTSSVSFPFGSRKFMSSYSDSEYVTEPMFKVRVTDDGGLQRLRKHSYRTSYSIAINGEVETFYYGENNTPMNAASLKTAISGIYRKMTNWDIRTQEKEVVPSNSSGVNLRLIRLSHVYLMYAEALIKGGSDDSGLTTALTYVNKVRRRAGANLVGSVAQSTEFSSSDATFDGNLESPRYQATTGLMTAKELMKHLMYVERPLEMCQEGFHTRIADLRRWRNPDTGVYNVTGDRFKELATDPNYRYTFDTFYFLKTAETTGAWSKGTNWYYQARYNSSIEYESDEEYYNDFAQANIVYNASGTNDWYWPIPSGEKIANPNL